MSALQVYNSSVLVSHAITSGAILYKHISTKSHPVSYFLHHGLSIVQLYVFARVCLSVCLLARLLKNVLMDLDEMLRVDRCRDMDKLINF